MAGEFCRGRFDLIAGGFDLGAAPFSYAVRFKTLDEIFADVEFRRAEHTKGGQAIYGETGLIFGVYDEKQDRDSF